MKIRNSVKALIVRDDHFLVIKKHDQDGEYYLLVGGGQEPGETFTETVKRECLEEIGAEVQPNELLFIREYIGKNHEQAEFDFDLHQIEYMFSCTLLSEPDMKRATQLDTNQVGIEWLPLHNITQYRLYPKTLCVQLQKHFIHHEKTEVYLGDVN
ncbi:ADP-ribose pyrophosphatase YjhB, NUDIX family [Bacillus sp. 491mf]|uniref:NUDIX domain-containing protein n=1 Tax=Bacillus TaxID=1386 RepID=UPI0005502316|nr:MULTISPECIES: NUDIX domain-containing protein [unclassified Bacillus (in: firmicutes)]SFC14275.1 ADP-ribose pyrophosphatase YjhB, NUDIX family [Bacillus sp. 491mf]